MSSAWFDRMYPGIAWRLPIYLTPKKGPHGWACRFCLIRRVLEAKAIGPLWPTEADVETHLAAAHLRSGTTRDVCTPADALAPQRPFPEEI